MTRRTFCPGEESSGKMLFWHRVLGDVRFWRRAGRVSVKSAMSCALFQPVYLKRIKRTTSSPPKPSTTIPREPGGAGDSDCGDEMEELL